MSGKDFVELRVERIRRRDGQFSCSDPQILLHTGLFLSKGHKHSPDHELSGLTNIIVQNHDPRKIVNLSTG